jgi:hypothetical protein
VDRGAGLLGFALGALLFLQEVPANKTERNRTDRANVFLCIDLEISFPKMGKKT